MTQFKQRVFGAVMIKAINSNYNADFTGQPRTLPDGRVYATDKAFKYTVRYYSNDCFPEEKIFYFRTYKDDLNPLSLDEKYKALFGKDADPKNKPSVAKNLLDCIDIRWFGATFAGKTNVSIHGPVQVTHGINIWKENNIYTEQITSPFAKKDSDNEQTSIGRQTKLQEGHYLHHFSINPQNLEEVASVAGADAKHLSKNDIDLLKEAMRKGASYYDSSSKAGTENEFLIWVQLNEDSQLVLPSFLQLISMEDEKEDGKVILNLEKLNKILGRYESQIELVEIYFNPASVLLQNEPSGAKKIEMF